MAQPNRLDLAIEEFFNEKSLLSFADKFSNLRQAYMWNGLELIRKINKREKLSEDELSKQEEGLKQFKMLEKMYLSELKAGKVQGKSSEALDREWTEKLKKSDSHIGSIVRQQKQED